MSKESILSNIPDYEAFLTVDELNGALIRLGREYPDRVAVFEAGRSRKDRPIMCAKLGNGPKTALLYGCPHPNEPIGAMMCHYMARALAEDKAYLESLGFTLYIIPVSDVDGTVLNEGWFKGPFTIYNYARNYFRPDGEQQVEWTFPMKYKRYEFNAPIPETQALMRLIDEIKPDFIYSLHNGGFGGAYWYVGNAGGDDLYKAFHKAAERGKVPLDLGEPEMPFAESLAPAVYKMPYAADMYDFYEKFGGKDPLDMMSAGECSASYAGPGTAMLVTELPYFYDPRVDSVKTLDYPRREAALGKLRLIQNRMAFIKRHYEQLKTYISPDNPFAGMIASSVRLAEGSDESQRVFIMDNPDFDKPCKESEAFSNDQMTRFYNLLGGGLLLRSAEFELERFDGAEAPEALLNIANEAKEILKSEAAALEADLDYSVIPIKSLVGIQLECGLSLMEYIRDNKEESK
ncbi:MAG: hypothetical protein LBS19_07110 [Clostridiales bacterium]|jgi:hypothetical protein|nr:hypothetical protein [Clostridiales bacterium]